MKTKQLKARRMWANYYPNGAVFARPTKAASIRALSPRISVHACVPVAVIPLDDVEALVCEATLAATNAARKLVFKAPLSRISDSEHPENNCDITRAALTAIGVLPKQRKKGRK